MNASSLTKLETNLNENFLFIFPYPKLPWRNGISFLFEGFTWTKVWGISLQGSGQLRRWAVSGHQATLNVNKSFAPNLKLYDNVIIRNVGITKYYYSKNV